MPLFFDVHDTNPHCCALIRYGRRRPAPAIITSVHPHSHLRFLSQIPEREEPTESAGDRNTRHTTSDSRFSRASIKNYLKKINLPGWRDLAIDPNTAQDPESEPTSPVIPSSSQPQYFSEPLYPAGPSSPRSEERARRMGQQSAIWELASRAERRNRGIRSPSASVISRQVSIVSLSSGSLAGSGGLSSSSGDTDELIGNSTPAFNGMVDVLYEDYMRQQQATNLSTVESEREDDTLGPGYNHSDAENNDTGHSHNDIDRKHNDIGREHNDTGHDHKNIGRDYKDTGRDDNDSSSKVSDSISEPIDSVPYPNGSDSYASADTVTHRARALSRLEQGGPRDTGINKKALKLFNLHQGVMGSLNEHYTKDEAADAIEGMYNYCERQGQQASHGQSIQSSTSPGIQDMIQEQSASQLANSNEAAAAVEPAGHDEFTEYSEPIQHDEPAVEASVAPEKKRLWKRLAKAAKKILLKGAKTTNSKGKGKGKEGPPSDPKGKGKARAP